MNLHPHLNYPVLLSALLLAFGTHIDATARTAAKKSAGRASMHKVAMAPDDAAEFANFTQWREVSDFIDRMAATHGFERADLEAMFRKVRYVDATKKLIKPAPPGKPKNWQAYRARFVEPVRIDAGVAFWNQYADALARAEEQYGVPAEIIVGIIGVETIYGRNTGSFRVLDALTTLAFDYPDTPTRTARMEFFRGELENTLLFARESNIDPFSLLGSYAGAIGLPQFMPGSIRSYAVDFDGDGKIDLRNSPVDAIGSVAQFSGRAWLEARRADRVPGHHRERRKQSRLGCLHRPGAGSEFRLDELKAAGVRPSVEPPADMLYGLVDLQNGTEPTEYWLGAQNFFAITRYNRSYFYAMSVVDLGRAVRVARGN